MLAVLPEVLIEIPIGSLLTKRTRSISPASITTHRKSAFLVLSTHIRFQLTDRARHPLTRIGRLDLHNCLRCLGMTLIPTWTAAASLQVSIRLRLQAKNSSDGQQKSCASIAGGYHVALDLTSYCFGKRPMSSPSRSQPIAASSGTIPGILRLTHLPDSERIQTSIATVKRSRPRYDACASALKDPAVAKTAWISFGSKEYIDVERSLRSRCRVWKGMSGG